MEEEYFEEEVVDSVVASDEEAEYLVVCPECGEPLTEIPYYGRYYCQACGNHI